MLNYIIYELEFHDGQVKYYATNVITDNMLSNVDEEGHSVTIVN